ncbi:hypothetical protein [Nocardiopsis sp. NPDC006938]|uniref:hypothetical protein n=1 Tax=Nocardiopsis sp. NPDC006938 TaxID=3364337 RepID=UPI00368D3AC7
MSETNGTPTRTTASKRAAGLLLSSLLVLGGGFTAVAPAAASTAPASGEVGAASCYGYTSLSASRSIGGTVTTSCRQGRSWAQHGRVYVQTAWATQRSQAVARGGQGATPRKAGWEILR